MTDQTTAGGSVSPYAYPCGGCGARVEYAPGTNVLRCPYCGHEQQLVASGQQVREHAYAELAGLPHKPLASLGAYVFRCQKCGAQTQSYELASTCQFCAAPLVADATAGDQIAPEAVLPFQVDRGGVRTALRGWVSSRWFAPSRLKKVTEAESLKGTYLPHWTFDSRTVSRYQGQRGEHYWVTETYTATVNGQSQVRTRQVQHTRWHPASGTVQRNFDDVLVPAASQMSGEQLDELAPWPLPQAVTYQPAYLAGYHALRYDIQPEAGLERAKARMAPVIQEDCRHDIGGDEQQVQAVNTSYSDITYKLVLLPVWIACYLYAGRTWQVLVNARTGEVIGQRPYSVVKIAGAVLGGLAVVAAIILLIVLSRQK
jgi:Zn finger protein HypA/HybF involved in hydrogenase expression